MSPPRLRSTPTPKSQLPILPLPLATCHMAHGHMRWTGHGQIARHRESRHWRNQLFYVFDCCCRSKTKGAWFVWGCVFVESCRSPPVVTPPSPLQQLHAPQSVAATAKLPGGGKHPSHCRLDLPCFWCSCSCSQFRCRGPPQLRNWAGPLPA
jgi:hypothetical protein